jgi:hypothetical protein
MTDATLQFHELNFLPEGDTVLVGRPGTTSYAVLPVDGAALLERMVSGVTPAAAADWYEATYGDPVDVHDFVATIGGLGFLATGDDVTAAPAEPIALQGFARALFSAPAFALYALIAAAWVVTIVRDPALAPRPAHLFFTRYLVLVQLLLLLGQLPMLFLHEAFHVLAGRRLGLPSRVGIGRRMWMLVVETRMPDLLAVPRRRRYLPFLAGMLADVLVVSTLGLLAYALRGAHGPAHALATVALALAFPVCVRFGYQFLLFLQTDVYFVITTALGCYDLHAAARTLIANRFWRAAGRPERLRSKESFTPRDRRAARWYAPLFAVGGAVLLVVAVEAIVPVVRGCVRLAVAAAGSSVTGIRFWDAALFIASTIAQFAIYAYLVLRAGRRPGRARLRATSTNPAEKWSPDAAL